MLSVKINCFLTIFQHILMAVIIMVAAIVMEETWKITPAAVTQVSSYS